MRGARVATALAAVAAALVAASSATASTAVSSNWSGYVVTGTTYATVSASWTEPRADCTAAPTSTTAAAFWIGLGGDRSGSDALEQAGTEADCTASGDARYSAWYELLPAGSVRLPLVISPGDRIEATVAVHGRRVTIDLVDATAGTSVERTLTMAAPDTSSAEWIAEAPSVVTGFGTEVLPLTDFGSVAFGDARVTSATGHTGTISDRAWTASRVVLETSGGGPGVFGRFADQISAALAVPSALSAAGSRFSVAWQTTEPGAVEPTGPPSFGPRGAA